MTPNAVAFYAIAVLIVLAAGAAAGLPSLRRAGYAGAAVIVLMAVPRAHLGCLRPGGGSSWWSLELPGGCGRARAPARYIPRTRHRTGASGTLLDRRSDCDRDRCSAGDHPGGGRQRLVSGEPWGPAPAYHNGASLVTVLHYRTPLCPRHRCRGGRRHHRRRARHRPAER